MNPSKSQGTFLHGVALLSISTVLVKLIGVLYKIPLVHLLGAQGMGYFNAAYDVYALLCLVSTTGLPVAVSVLLGRQEAHKRAVFRVSLLTFLILGILGCGAVLAFARPIANAIGAPDAVQSLRAIAPALLFICIGSAFRGYSQGLGDMRPTAVSQVIEAACKLALGLLLSYRAVRLGLPLHVAAAHAISGLSLATLLSTAYLWLSYRKKTAPGEQTAAKPCNLLGKLLQIALPVTLGAVMSGASKLLDLGLIMRRLQDAGVAQQTAVSLYGAYSAMAIPLFGAVPALLGSLAMPLIPHLTRAIAQHDVQSQQRILLLSMRLTALVSIPSALGMSMLADSVLSLLYADKVAQAPSTVPMLLILAMAIPASCMITTTNAILQSYGKPWQGMVSMGIGCAVKALALYFLTVNPQIGVLAAPISTWLCCTVTVAINLFSISRVAPIAGWQRAFLASCAVSAVSVGVAAALKRLWLLNAPVPVTVTCSVLCAVVIFILLSFAVGLVRLEDIKSLK